MYFWTYGLQKTWLDKCLESLVSEGPSTSNVVNGSRHCSNLSDNTFTVFIVSCEDNYCWKNLSEWYEKSLGLFVYPLIVDSKYCLLNT